MNSKIENIGLHHIALATADFDRTLEFYTDGLGCQLARIWGEGSGRAAMLDIGNGVLIEVFANGTPDPAQNEKWVHIAFKTSNPDQAYANAIKAGAASHMEPKDMTIQSDPPMDVRIAFVKGPSGEIIEFFQEKSGEIR